MKSILKTSILSLAVAAMTLSAVSTASADRWHRHHRSNGDAVAAGVLGLAAGAIVGGLLSDSRRNDRVYIDPPRRYYPVERDYYPVERDYYPAEQRYNRPYAQPTYYRSTLEPWSREWYRYCSTRYRSFDARSGTFMGYDGRRHFCQPN
ncbi:BA14K family protein [Nitratireductor soli]|uniref:BA14K family protein n=1 Tax=Nitratireductor soli TaxID=1670619 RepID=UPI00065E3D40|nr:BA14K family protein [Nitratireductor soli]